MVKINGKTIKVSGRHTLDAVAFDLKVGQVHTEVRQLADAGKLDDASLKLDNLYYATALGYC